MSAGSRAQSRESHFALRTFHGLVDACTLVGSLHALPLLACSLSGPSHILWTAPGAVGFARALGVTAHGLDESTRALLVAVGPTVIVHAHAGPGTSLLTACGHGTGLSSPLTGLGHGSGVGGLG